MKKIYSSIIFFATSVSAILLFSMCSKPETTPEDEYFDVISVSVDATVPFIFLSL